MRWWKTLAIALGIGVSSEVLYLGYKWLKKGGFRKKKNESESKKEVEEVLFFPDLEVACKDYFVGEDGCNKRSCKFSHEHSSLSRLYQFLHEAKYTLDVCVFVICCADLADILVEAHQNSVLVRVICDDEQLDVSGSQIWKLKKAGIHVRTDHSSYLMHHKFVVVDGRILLTGSFNWTRQAISGNQENLLALSNRRIVSLYRREFEKLWKNFDPRNYTDSALHAGRRDVVDGGGEQVMPRDK